MAARRKVLVTGADGFIGSHVVETFVRAGADVRAFCLYNSLGLKGWLDYLPAEIAGEVETCAGDLRDPIAVHNAANGCDQILHLGALIAIPYSYQAPDAYVAVNITGTLNVLQAARQCGAEVVCTSTSEVYGSAQFVPITEDHPLDAQSPYAATKIAADQLALSYHRSFDLPVTVLRPFNTYGPRQSMRAVIPTIVMQLVRGERKIKLGALRPTRDFTFVRDTARGFLQIAGCPETFGGVYNIGSSFEISIGDTVREIADLFGVEVDIEQEDDRMRPQKSEVERLCAGCDRAVSTFGWAPEFGGSRAGFRRGLEETVAWFRNAENLTLYRQQGYVV